MSLTIASGALYSMERGSIIIMTLTQIKLPAGLFEAQRVIDNHVAEGWEPEGLEHIPAYEGNGPETWLTMRRPAMAA